MTVLAYPGDALPDRRIASVSATAMKTMAVILADPNQIHLDPNVVRDLGLGDRTINQGPTGCGYIMNMLLEAFPNGRIRSFKVRFLANVFAGDSVIAGGRVVETSDQSEGSLVTCDVWLDVEGGRRAIEGRATVAAHLA